MYTDDIMADVRNYKEHICPNPITPEWLQQQYADKKMLPLSELISGRWYYGYCRNARIAMWDDGQNRPAWATTPEAVKGDPRFWYIRKKFSTIYAESICHPENDNGFDLFWPVKEVEFPFPTTSNL